MKHKPSRETGGRLVGWMGRPPFSLSVRLPGSRTVHLDNGAGCTRQCRDAEQVRGAGDIRPGQRAGLVYRKRPSLLASRLRPWRQGSSTRATSETRRRPVGGCRRHNSKVSQLREFSLLEFIAELPAIAHDVEAAGPMILEKAAQMVEKRAKGMIGHEHDGLWPPLSESTLKDKAAHGYKTPAPLLRSGEFRDSFEHVVQGHEAEVGTNDPRGPWFEFGTSKMPPRPVLVPAAIAVEGRIHRMATAVTIGVLSGYGRHARDVRKILHLLHRAGHALYELGHDLLEDDDAEGANANDAHQGRARRPGVHRGLDQGNQGSLACLCRHTGREGTHTSRDLHRQHRAQYHRSGRC
jgi:hypothetical protein